MKELRDIQPFGTEVRLVHLPASRIIGLEVESGGTLGNAIPALWDRAYVSDLHTTLEALPCSSARSCSAESATRRPKEAVSITSSVR